MPQQPEGEFVSIITASHWQQVTSAEWPGIYFSPEEVADNRDGSLKVWVPALAAMDRIRAQLDRPIRVNSWYRTPKHDADIKGAGAHPTGKAIDVAISGADALAFINFATRAGFTGIGVSQKGPHQGRFIHVDMMDNTKGRPRPWIWSY